jgi:co-chaperonin GroES (HSP10)
VLHVPARLPEQGDPPPCLQVKQVTPVGERVFVKAEEAEAKTLGGILRPSSAQKRPTQGTVQDAGSAKGVKVGAGPASTHVINSSHQCLLCLRQHFLFLLQSGDKVVYSKYAGTELELQGDSFVLLKVRWVQPVGKVLERRRRGPLAGLAMLPGVPALQASGSFRTIDSKLWNHELVWLASAACFPGASVVPLRLVDTPAQLPIPCHPGCVCAAGGRCHWHARRRRGHLQAAAPAGGVLLHVKSS